MTVVNPKSISGITSITTASGSDNLLTIHTNNGTERLRVDSTGTTKIVTGIVTTLTATTGIVTTLTASTVTSLGDVDIADKIVHTGDTDTAIRFSAADTVSVETGGTQKLSLGSATVFNETGADVDFRIESSGTANMFLLDAGNNRIGLNRPTPIEMFEVGGNIFLSSNTSNANEGNALKFQSKTGGFDTSYGAAIHGLRVGDASSYLRFDTGGQSEKMRLDSSGHLLIGTTTEGVSTADDLTLATDGNTGITIRSGSSSNGNIFFSDGTSGNAELEGYIQYDHSSNYMRFATGATERLRITSTGDVNIGGNLTQTDSRVHIQDVTRPLQEGTLTLSSASTTDGAANNGSTLRFHGHDGSSERYQASIRGAKENGTSGNYAAYMAFNTRPNGGGMVERARIDSSGRLLIGVTASYANASIDELQIGNNSSSNQSGITIGSTDECAIAFADAGDVRAGSITYNHGSDAMIFKTVGQNERLRITSDGQLLVGANDYSGGGTEPVVYVSGTSGRMVKIHNTGTETCSIQLTNAATGQGEDQGFMLAALSSRAAYVANIEPFPIYFATDGNIRATISGSAEQMVVGAQDGFTDYGINNGILTAYATSGYNSTYHVLKVIHANTSFSETGGGALFIGCRRTSTAAYNLAGWYSGNGSTSVADDRQYRFRADGNAYADGSWNGGGADYAEFFEWLDGNSSDENRKGTSVVLEDGKIRAATGSDNTDNIIGVISANPVVVGDSASERWKEKWITDDFGDPVYEEYTITEWYDETKKEKVNYATDRIPSDVTVGAGSSILSTDHKGNAFTRKKLNPSWDSTATYIPRKDRKEWDIVGLMGKLKVKSDQPVGTKWIKMREISASVHEYLIR